MDRVILHSDINCCYASIEHLYRPELRGKPLAVGGDPEARHGIILTADYTCKGYGVKVGMPLWQAKQLCHDMIIVQPRMDLYLRFSKMAHEIYADYTELQEPYGIDESWLDVSESCNSILDGEKIARKISDRMKCELGITVSIGVSWNKVFAKLGSDYKKPDGITVFSRDRMDIIRALPAEDLLYVGRSTKRKLRNMGIYTIGELADTPEGILDSHLGKMGLILKAFASGYDEAPVRMENTFSEIKSIGNSTTTPRDLETLEDVKITVYLLAESVGARMRENGFKCRTVEMWVRDNELTSFVRQKKLSYQTNITDEIANEAMDLFIKNYDLKRPVRSLGVRGSCLVPENDPEQISLFEDADARAKLTEVDRAVDSIRKRFGYYSIRRGMMLQDTDLALLNAKEDHVAHPVGYFG